MDNKSLELIKINNKAYIVGNLLAAIYHYHTDLTDDDIYNSVNIADKAINKLYENI